MKRINSLLALAGLLLGINSYVAADNVISTAAGGAFPNGYFGSLVSTSTTVMRGTVICKQGIDIGTNKLFYDADGPVYGRIMFNQTGVQGGSLLLASDLRLGSTCELRSGAENLYLKIDGRGGNSIIMGDDLRLTFSTQFLDDTVIDGRGHTLTLQAPIEIGDATVVPKVLTLRNMRLVVYPGVAEPFQLVAGTASGSVVLQNVDLYLPPNQLTFLEDAIEVVCHRQVRLMGPGGTLRFLNTALATPSLFIDKCSSLKVEQDVTFSVWGDAGGGFLLQGLDASSECWLDGCKLDHHSRDAGPSILPVSNLNMYFDNKVTVSVTAGEGVATPDEAAISIDALTVNAQVRGGATVNVIGTMLYE